MTSSALNPFEASSSFMISSPPIDGGMQAMNANAPSRVYLEENLRRVFINGTHNNDIVTVAGGSTANLIVVKFSGVETREFNTADFDYILFKGRFGDDLFSNATDVVTQAFGDGDNDSLYGGNGDDVIEGGAGDDRLYGRRGHDRIIGGGGNDLIYGSDGNDWLRGGAGNDVLSGDDGEDTLLGDNGDDQLHGHGGDDLLYGWNGNDTLDGGQGSDSLYDASGNDSLSGGPGNDFLLGGDGNDTLSGGAGNDRLRGGNGDDALYGNEGVDYLFGDAGHDQLFGGHGTDDLSGNDGVDLLLGGVIAERDVLRGGNGVDHLLYFGENVLVNSSAATDVRVRLVNSTSSWTEVEVRVINEGLQKLHDATNNSRLLRDWVTGDDLRFVKVKNLPGGGTAENYLEFTTKNGNTTYYREIRFSDWNESNEPLNQTRVLALAHEIGHNYDNGFELAKTPYVSPALFDTFLGQSGWRKTNPNNAAYARSGDGQWWYLRSAQFYRSYSTLSPYEDWATIWELAFNDAETEPPPTSGLGKKLSLVRQLFGALKYN